MADFESAARRLAADQSRLRSKARSRGAAGGSALSARAKREAEQRKKREEERRREREAKRRRMAFVGRYMKGNDNELGVVRSLKGGGSGDENGEEEGSASAGAVKAPLSGGLFGSSVPPAVTWSGATKTGLMLQATSVHGDGDKIALPPSVLSVLAERGMMEGGGRQQPLTFRVGVLRDGYAFPSSSEMKVMMEKAPTDADDSAHDDDENDDMEVDANDGQNGTANEDGSYEPTRTAPYLAELSRRYVAYTHGTVVEFTQEEGCVGLPAGMASALLSTERQRKSSSVNLDVVEVPRTRTVDPAATSASTEPVAEDGDKEVEKGGATADENGNGAILMERDVAMDDSERTPGHLAYGLFDIPSSPVEVTLLRLPKGRRCKLIPTPDSIRNGFYDLKDVKLVLEQSLIRTRATLSVGDVVHAWHRGTKFDLTVGGVQPAEWGAVSCINTDIEVDIAAPNGGVAERKEPRDASSANSSAADGEAGTEKKEETNGFAPGRGRRLTDSAGESPPTVPTKAAPAAPSARPLPPEPPADQREGVCTVQIRGDGVAGRRRFVVSSATMGDVFAFASSLFAGGEAPTFRLVTRFPRKVFELAECVDKTMDESGVRTGQEAFLVERT